MDEASRKSAFSAFYRKHYSLILATGERRLNDHSAAEDATAEVFRVAWQQHDRGAELSLPWLYVVARNVIGSEYRRRARLGALVARLTSHSNSEILRDEQTGSELRAAMLRLKISEREILFMAYWEDLSGEELAKILDCSSATALVRLSRARQALKSQLAQLSEGAR